MPAVALSHPWILQLQGALDALEKALLAGEATAVEAASAQVQTILKNAPRTADIETLLDRLDRQGTRFIAGPRSTGAPRAR